MYLFSVLYGLFYIGLGFFVKKYPDTIAGYNTLPPRRKKKVDIKGLSAYLKKILIITGICVIVEYPVLALSGFEEAAVVLLCVIPVVLLVFAAFQARKYNLYKRK